MFSLAQVRSGSETGLNCATSQIVPRWAALAAFACSVAGCEAPGEGPAALQGFKASATVLHALGAYRAAHGQYPSELQALVPRFLSASQLQPTAPVLPLEYKLRQGEFQLQFEYHGPGVNRCSFDSAERAWSCSGHY